MKPVLQMNTQWVYDSSHFSMQPKSLVTWKPYVANLREQMFYWFENYMSYQWPKECCNGPVFPLASAVILLWCFKLSTFGFPKFQISQHANSNLKKMKVHEAELSQTCFKMPFNSNYITIIFIQNIFIAGAPTKDPALESQWHWQKIIFKFHAITKNDSPTIRFH